MDHRIVFPGRVSPSASSAYGISPRMGPPANNSVISNSNHLRSPLFSPLASSSFSAGGVKTRVPIVSVSHRPSILRRPSEAQTIAVKPGSMPNPKTYCANQGPSASQKLTVIPRTSPTFSFQNPVIAALPANVKFVRCSSQSDNSRSQPSVVFSSPSCAVSNEVGYKLAPPATPTSMALVPSTLGASVTLRQINAVASDGCDGFLESEETVPVRKKPRKQTFDDANVDYKFDDDAKEIERIMKESPPPIASSSARKRNASVSSADQHQKETDESFNSKPAPNQCNSNNSSSSNSTTKTTTTTSTTATTTTTANSSRSRKRPASSVELDSAEETRQQQATCAGSAAASNGSNGRASARRSRIDRWSSFRYVYQKINGADVDVPDVEEVPLPSVVRDVEELPRLRECRMRLTSPEWVKRRSQLPANHFRRMDDLKAPADDQRRATVLDVISGPNFQTRLSGWRLAHVGSQLDQLIEAEMEQDSAVKSVDFFPSADKLVVASTKNTPRQTVSAERLQRLISHVETELQQQRRRRKGVRSQDSVATKLSPSTLHLMRKTLKHHLRHKLKDVEEGKKKKPYEPVRYFFPQVVADVSANASKSPPSTRSSSSLLWSSLSPPPPSSSSSSDGPKVGRRSWQVLHDIFELQSRLRLKNSLVRQALRDVGQEIVKTVAYKEQVMSICERFTLHRRKCTTRRR